MSQFCSFCSERAVAPCSNAACKAFVCDGHGTIVGISHFHTVNPKNHIVLTRILCDRCNGVSLYPNLDLIQAPPTNTADPANASPEATKRDEPASKGR